MVIIKLYAGLNTDTLQFIGQGTQGKVYKIDSQKCIKIFKKREICQDEIETLAMAQENFHFPKIYSFGKDYIIREYVYGIELDKYLSSEPFTKSISMKILELYEAMYLVGYTRLDAAPFHIFLTPSNNIKLIDTARAMKKQSIYPSLIFKCLEDFGYKEEFLNYVKSTNLKLYSIWMHNKK